jgi:two-component system response regulator AtoC
VDVRLIAATNRDLKAAVEQGAFREDLFYRLNVVPITIPPLRARREDILPLALDIVRQLNEELKRSFTGFTRAAADVLERYPWPGNIRELKNVIERTMILAPDGEIDAVHLPAELRSFAAERPAVASPVPPLVGNNGQQPLPTLREVEDRYIEQVLTAVGQNKSRAARVLGIHPTSLLRRLRKHSRSIGQ